MSLAHIFTLTGDGRLRPLLYNMSQDIAYKLKVLEKPHKTTSELNQTR